MLIKQILTSNSSIRTLILQNANIRHLDKIFKSFLDPILAKHCHLAHIKEDQGQMIALVAIDSPTWATRLKYEIPDIIKNLTTQTEFKNLAKINYSIKEQEDKPEIKNQKQHLSPENEKRWQEIRNKLKK